VDSLPLFDPENPLFLKKKRRAEALNPEHPSGGGSESDPENPLFFLKKREGLKL
jgi:hypothetical protein